MSAEELSQFYGAALTGGAILSGFVATFLSFRIQREADYYRQPVLRYKPDEECGNGQDVFIDLSRFPPSLLLIIVSWFGSTFFGVLWPLSALAHWSPSMTGPAPLLAGIASSVALVAAYFFAEMFHYAMFRSKRGPQWGLVRCLLPLGEWGLVMCFLLLAILFGVVTYCVVKGRGDANGRGVYDVFIAPLDYATDYLGDGRNRR